MSNSPFQLSSLSRREALDRLCVGFGGLALNAMLFHESKAEAGTAPWHFPPRAKRVIFLFMHGGPSHVDLFDYKPNLEKYNGQALPFPERKVQFAKRGNLMQSPWSFRKVGQCGHWMSELWQHLPKVADDICMLNSLCETNVAHGGACMKLHTGNESLLRPSLGSWVSYGLGTENRNLPSFVTICPTSLHGGVDNFGAAFLPGEHQGVALGTQGYPNTLAKNARFHYVEANSQKDRSVQELQLRLLNQLQTQKTMQLEGKRELETRLKSFELAFRMQTEAKEATDISGESQSTRKLYGLNEPETENFGHQCLLARRLAERGVRFIQVSHAHSLPFNNEQWDQHSHLEKGHSVNVRQIDKPITGLIMDLKSRGMLNDTLVLWGGEFGRTPSIQAGDEPVGRDHHPDGFSMWMAGGGVKGGMRYGATDDFGYHAVQDRCTIHDLHATLLHLMGLDHERLTYNHLGREFRLTDVSGYVAHKILA